MGFMEGYEMMAGNRRMKIAESQNALAWQQFAEQQAERDKRDSAAGKAAEAAYDADPDLASSMGMTKESFRNLSALDKAARVRGVYEAQGQRKLMQELAARKMEMDADSNFTQAMTDSTKFTTAMPSPSAPGFMPDLPVQTTGTPTRASIMQAMAAHPLAWQSKRADPLLNYHLLQDPETAGLVPGVAQPISGAPGHMFVPLSRGSGTVINTAQAKPTAVYTNPEQHPAGVPPKGFQWIWDGEKWKMASERGENPLSILLGNGGAVSTGGPAQAPSAPPAEVVRLTKDGRKAVFDANTKQFLRYADTN